MKSQCLAGKIAIVAIISLCTILPLPVRAASSNADMAPCDAFQKAADNGDDLSGRCAALALRCNVQIAVDPDILPVHVEAPGKQSSLTNALDSLARQIPGVVWRRIWVNKDAVLPPPARLAASVRVLEHLPPPGVAVENPTMQRTLFFLPHNRLSAADAPTQESAKAKKRIYLFYTTGGTTDGLTMAERLGDLQDQYLDLLSRLPASERPNPAQDGVRILQSMDTQQREAFMRKALEAGTQAWNSADASVRDEMVQQFVQTVQQAGPPPQNPRNDASADVGERASQNHYEELRRIVDAMARRFHVRIVIEPSLWLSEKPQPPPNTLSLDQALDALMESAKDITWRRIYYRQSATAALPVNEAVAAVRTLEHSYQTELDIESPVWLGRTILQTKAPSVALQVQLQRNQFSPTPTYILYARREGRCNGLSMLQRLADLQQQQAAMLINVNSEQLAELMTGQALQYQTLNAGMQSSIMHLPLSAILMAVWMPRKAQEAGTAGPP